jgi:hypothetical protein
MCTLRSARPPVKPRQHVREVKCEPAVRGTGADYFVHVWQDGKFFTYWLRRLATDYGVGFRFEQGGANPALSEMQLEVYNVCVDGEHGSCECPGHRRWGVECRHLWALRELLGRGDIPSVRPDHPSTDDPALTAYKPAGHDHGLPF